jgi:hypothetical protein
MAVPARPPGTSRCGGRCMSTRSSMRPHRQASTARPRGGATTWAVASAL